MPASISVYQMLWSPPIRPKKQRSPSAVRLSWELPWLEVSFLPVKPASEGWPTQDRKGSCPNSGSCKRPARFRAPREGPAGSMIEAALILISLRPNPTPCLAVLSYRPQSSPRRKSCTLHCGEPFQAWEMWLSPHSEKPVESEVGGQDPHPWTGSPVGNQACIVPRLLWDLFLLKLPHPEAANVYWVSLTS